MDLGLHDHVVVITGANGGIGRALAEGFAAEGCRLGLLAGTQEAALRAWVAEQAWAERAVCGAVELRDPESVAAGFAAVRRAHGRVDHAVANAGIWPAADLRLHEMPAERVQRVIDVDLVGALWTARAFVAGLAELGPREGAGASLCFIGSTAGQFGEAGHVAYSASKAALRGVVRSLKNEIVHLDPAGRVNLVDPGWTRTPMAAAAMEDATAVERSLSTTPLRRIGAPDDVASACIFLASPTRARHLTGQVVGVHGGMEGRRLW